MAPTELYARRVGNANAALPPDICGFVDSFASSSAAFAEATAPKGEADRSLAVRNAPQRTRSNGAGQGIPMAARQAKDGCFVE